jgi:hypothetical protein
MNVKFKELFEGVDADKPFVFTGRVVGADGTVHFSGATPGENGQITFESMEAFDTFVESNGVDNIIAESIEGEVLDETAAPETGEELDESSIITPYGKINSSKEGFVVKHAGGAKSIHYELMSGNKMKARVKDHKSVEDAVAEIKGHMKTPKMASEENLQTEGLTPVEIVDETVVSEAPKNDNVEDGNDAADFKKADEIKIKPMKKEKKATTESTDEETEEVVATESIEFAGDKRAVARKVRKIEGAVVEKVSDEIVSVTYPANLREDVVRDAAEFLTNEDIGLHLVKEGAGKSFYRVLSESGFTGENVNDLATVFRAAVNERVASREAEFDARVEVSVKKITEGFANELDGMAAEFVAEWMTENKVNIASNLKLTLAEELVTKVLAVVSESGIMLPESKLEVLESLEEEVGKKSNLLSEVTSERDALAERVRVMESRELIAEFAEERNLSLAQRERLSTMLEDHEGDMESLREKAETLATSFFQTKRKDDSYTRSDVISESAIIDTDEKKPDVYASFLKRGRIAIPE